MLGLFGKKRQAETLNSYEKTLDQQAINFFNTFGFIKLPGFFKTEIKLISTEFDKLMKAKFGDTSERRNYLYPQFIDNSRVLTDLLLLPRISHLMSGLLGDDFIYKGSDGNIFSSPTPWHRDYYIRTKSCKMLVYLESNDETNGAIRMIPGTHFVDDAYSSFLDQALTWPEPPVLGGFDEKKYFGSGHDPRAFGQNRYIPQTVVTNEPGDAIVFNHNLIHCTNAGKWPRRRRLMGLHFCVNPNNDRFYGLDQVSRDEIKTLSLVEMESFSLPRMFGPEVLNHPSQEIQRMIGPLKELRFEKSGDFNGLYSAQCESSIEFCNRLKSSKCLSKEFLN